MRIRIANEVAPMFCAKWVVVTPVYLWANIGAGAICM